MNASLPDGGPLPEGPRSELIRQAIAVVETGSIPAQPPRLTRRKRRIVVDADQCDGQATVWFVKRGHSGEPVDEMIRLERQGTTWVPRGGGGGAPGADLEHRLSLVELVDHPSRLYPLSKVDDVPFGYSVGSSRGQRHATVQFQTVVEAATLVIGDRPPRPIADHGYCLVAYSPHQPPLITALDLEGNRLGSFTPQRWAHRRRWFHRLPRPRRQHRVVGSNRHRRWRRR